MREESLTAVAEAIRARTLSPIEAFEGCLERVHKWDERIRAFMRLDEEGALESARVLEAEAAAGRWRGSLHGVPVGFKDLCHLRGLPTSCGTGMPGYFTSAQDCTAARRLLDAGAISLGKLNMTELALGAFGDNAHHGDADNPWLAGHATGGSSSGSGAGARPPQSGDRGGVHCPLGALLVLDTPLQRLWATGALNALRLHDDGAAPVLSSGRAALRRGAPAS
ncbi:MAG TPA: amidase family protein [Methylomirabilota bacterium]